jgi:hypothetical protein
MLLPEEHNSPANDLSTDPDASLREMLRKKVEEEVVTETIDISTL